MKTIDEEIKDFKPLEKKAVEEVRKDAEKAMQKMQKLYDFLDEWKEAIGEIQSITIKWKGK